MRRSLSILIITLLLCCPASAEEREVLGWVETARVYPGGMLFLAKLDTGAYSTHINARNIEEFEKDGEDWLRFEIVNRSGRSVSIELPRARDITVKIADEARETRPSVWMHICISNVSRLTLVSLDDRGEMLYPLLVGRKFIKDKFVIDPAFKFRARPKCEEPGDG